MDISVIIPLLNENDSLSELHSSIEKVMSSNSYSYEVIFIDDGSIDNSWDIISRLSKENQFVKGIRFFK
ncbi:MAG: glycosyltransferase, partial [Flavobacteriaceae bacterium]